MSEKHIEISLDRLAIRKYKNYGVAVLEDRAIPDYRDGMIPVSRRVLWSAYELGIHSKGKFAKSARIVGDTLGRFHPHGDCLRGDTLVPLLNGKTVTIKSLVDSGAGKKWILSYDEKTKNYKSALAYNWRVGQSTSTMYQVKLTNGMVFEVTGNHPFLTKYGSWVQAQYLTKGTNLVGGSIHTVQELIGNIPTDHLCMVDSVTQVKLKSKEDFYDFTVDGYENMIVCPADHSEVFAVVHNSSTYGAMVTMTNVGGAINNAHVALLEGEGNWGSFSDKRFAAMRYTEVRLAAISDKVLFNKFYMPVVRKSPNFDSTGLEPVVLPALLPIVFLNGVFGIAPGATTNIPACTLDSVKKSLKTIYDNGAKVDPLSLYKTLKFASLFGGRERLDTFTNEEKKDRRRMFKTTRGKTRLWGRVKFDEVKKVILIDRFGMASSAERVLEKVLSLNGVKTALDDSAKGEKYGTIKVVLSRNLTTKAYTKLVKQIDNLMASNENYVLNFTERYLDDEGQAQARMKPMSMTDAFQNWVNWRIKLEVAACSYWISQAEKEIRKLELLMIAVDNRKLIIESLDKDLNEKELDEWLASKLKISVEEAHFIYDLKVRQLRKLERKALELQMKEVVTKKKGLLSRKEKPLPHMSKQLEELTV